MAAVNRCFACGRDAMRVFYETTSIPVHSCLLLPTAESAAAYPRGDLALAFCSGCGFIQNDVFDPAVHEYSPVYEETQAFSPRFDRFQTALAQGLIERYGMRGKEILEIGCGKGDFLARLCELGDNRGTGIDPACVPERVGGPAAARIRFIRDLYGPAHADLAGDLVCCRHTLEHIRPVWDFVRLVRGGLRDRPDGMVFFEVPDTARVVVECAFWDIYYEHCSYFSLGSLTRLFRGSGFEVLDARRAFGDQYLLLDARPAGTGGGGPFDGEEDLAWLEAAVDLFSQRAGEARAGWSRAIGRWQERGLRVVAWGSGSKAVAFLTAIDVDDEIQYVVDVNPYRQGHYMPGLRQRIVGPAFLDQYRPDVVVVMNPIYREEIAGDLRDRGLEPELIPLGEWNPAAVQGGDSTGAPAPDRSTATEPAIARGRPS